MLLGPGPQDLAAARAQVEDATAQLLGPLTLLIPRLDVPSAARLLHDPERILGFALLLDLEAQLADAEGNGAAAAQARERATAFRSAAHACPQCGALYPDPTLTCQERFQALLALDHSRAEPWGSLHGVVFSCFTLQHPEGQERQALERAWIALYRIVVKGDEPARVFEGLRKAAPQEPAEWQVPPLPEVPPAGGPYAVTLAELGD